MEVVIKQKEFLDTKPNEYFIYFDFFKTEHKTIVTDKVRKYLKIVDLEVGDKIDVIKNFQNNKEKYLIRRVIKNG